MKISSVANGRDRRCELTLASDPAFRIHASGPLPGPTARRLAARLHVLSGLPALWR